MKKLLFRSLLIALVLVVIFSCDNPLKEHKCSVIKKEYYGSTNTNIYVRVPSQLNEDQLKKIALQLRTKNDDVQFLHIDYLLPNMQYGHKPWATTNFIPELEIVIIGSNNSADTNAQESSRQSTRNLKAEYKVENVRIAKDYSNAWGVKGMIRNKTSTNIKGDVKIKFINSKGDILHTARAFVNDGDSFRPGQAAPFEYYTNPSDFIDVVNFDIDFYKR